MQQFKHYILRFILHLLLFYRWKTACQHSVFVLTNFAFILFIFFNLILIDIQKQFWFCLLTFCIMLATPIQIKELNWNFLIRFWMMHILFWKRHKCSECKQVDECGICSFTSYLSSNYYCRCEASHFLHESK